MVQDITESKKQEAQYLQAQKTEAIGTLAGGIAHDFNNILRAITGYAELAKRRVTGDPTLTQFLDASPFTAGPAKARSSICISRPRISRQTGSILRQR